MILKEESLTCNQKTRMMETSGSAKMEYPHSSWVLFLTTKDALDRTQQASIGKMVETRRQAAWDFRT